MCPMTETLSLHASRCSNTSSAFGNVACTLSSSFASRINASSVSSMIKEASADRQLSIWHSSSKLTPLLLWSYNGKFKKETSPVWWESSFAPLFQWSTFGSGTLGAVMSLLLAFFTWNTSCTEDHAGWQLWLGLRKLGISAQITHAQIFLHFLVSVLWYTSSVTSSYLLPIWSIHMANNFT